MNYRSAVVLGQARPVVEPDEKLTGLRTVTEHVMPGRWDEARQPSPKELAKTSVIALSLAEASVKVRTGPLRAGIRGCRARCVGWSHRPVVSL